MEEGDRSSGPERGGPGVKTTLLVCLAILVAAAGAVVLIFRTEPVPTRAGATRETAMLVDVTEAEAGTFRPTIVATGTVRPAREVILRPRIDGRVMKRAKEFVPGGFVEEGEVLVRLDPSDYRNALQQRKSELKQARADLRLEMGRQDVARQEYQLLDESLANENRGLVLREPQLKAARSQVDSARAALEQARLELRRTTIEAPFEAHVLSRSINVGSQVASGDELARLVDAETYWVETTVPVSKLPWIRLPNGDSAAGSRVRVRNRSAWGEDAYRSGRLYKLIGSLGQDTRMARILVRVRDPLARKEGAAGKPRLMLGSYVRTRIRGRPLSDVVRLDRPLLRKDDTVWVMEEGKLAIREVRIALRDAEHAYIREGLRAGEKVVVTDLATVQEGAALRLDGQDTGSDKSVKDRPRARKTRKASPPERAGP